MIAAEIAEFDKQQAADREKRARDEQVVINCFHRVFTSDDGKVVLEFIKNQFGTDKPAFLPQKDGGYDPIHAAIRDGQRSVGIQIEHILTLPCIGDANIQTKPKVIR